MYRRIFSSLATNRAMVGAGATAAAATLVYNHTRHGELYYLAKAGARFLDPETAHFAAVELAKREFIVRAAGFDASDPAPSLRMHVFGHEIPSPLGLAAGFLKDGEGLAGARAFGFSFVEVGSVLPTAHAGEAFANNLSMPSKGFASVRANLLSHLRREPNPVVVGINLAADPRTGNSVGDLSSGVAVFGDIADFFVLNISCPNVGAVKDMRASILAAVETRNVYAPGKKLLVKLPADEKTALEVVRQAQLARVDGYVVCNSARAEDVRAALKTPNAPEGAISGRPLRDISTRLVALVKLAAPDAFIIGVGGVATGKDAYDKIRAGASLVEMYTAFARDGPAAVRSVHVDLAALLEHDGYSCVEDAVGTMSEAFAQTGFK